MGYVYVVEEDGKDCVKIGHSQNVDQRVRILQTGNSRKLGRIWQSSYVSGAEQAEHAIHKHFESRRAEGGSEWFHVPFDEAVDVAQEVCMISQLQTLTLENAELKKRIIDMGGTIS